MPTSPQVIIDVDGVLAKFEDLTGASEAEVKNSLRFIKPAVNLSKLSNALLQLSEGYTITFATARNYADAIDHTYNWLARKGIYEARSDNLIVGARTAFKPYLAMALSAKYIIDDHPKVIDLMYKIKMSSYCTPIFIKRDRSGFDFPHQAENILEAINMIMNGMPRTRDWDEIATIYNALYNNTVTLRDLLAETVADAAI